MRDIRFRAWDRERNQMHYQYLRFVPDSEYAVIDDNGSERFLTDVQQFTGLKDKNGKDIFEGDILGADSTPNQYEVYWNDHQAAWNVKGGAGFLPAWINSFTLGLEVIGNIYSNPELLNQNK
jgi:hypothetical protein